MAIRRSWIDRFTRGINAISEDSRRRLAEALSRIDYTQDVAVVREQAIAIMQAFCGQATDTTAMLAAEFYDGLREQELGQRMGALAESGREPEATDGAVRAFARKLVDGDSKTFVDMCLARLDYEVKVAASRTCLNNASRDTRKPLFARVPAGVETCQFCLMLASRGFAYHTEAAASHAHANCDCRVVPSWKSHAVEGYDLDSLKGEWEAAVQAEADARAERNGTDSADERRKIMKRYAESSRAAKKRTR